MSREGGLLKRLWRGGFERRLFLWMLTLSLGPVLILLLAGSWLWSGALEWLGTLGPWARVAETGRALLDAAEGAAAADPRLAAALARHREELSASLLLARRWAYLGERAAATVPIVALALAVAAAAVALSTSRRLARELARPIAELVDWTGRLAREERLPPRSPSEDREADEVRVLRAALRSAAEELARARQRALEAERVRVWGEMARRVAHEMKNPLTPLRLAAHRLEGAGGAGLAEMAAVVREETERLEELAGQFAALGRPPAGPRSPVDLRELLAGLLSTDVPAGIHAALDAPEDVPLVEAHHDALVRAFRNLIRNAVEAVASRDGEKRILVRVGVSRHAAAPSDGGGPRPCLEITIADTGPGLPPGAEDLVFEPDFTTKSRGTGLGLAIVRQAVRADGGEVSAGNRPEGGAEFVVRLPAAATGEAVRA